MSDPKNKWTRPQTAPAPMFFGEKERNLVKQVNDELAERVLGQTIAYYPISRKHTDYHPLYGEAIEKNFLPPIRVYALVEWNGNETTTTGYGLDRIYELTCHFHKRRLTEDQDLFVREGDFVAYGDEYFEIVKLGEPRLLFGQVDHPMEIAAECIKAREGLFDAT